MATQQLRDGREREAIIAATDRSLMIEAAAGTGKTRLLVDRILSGIRDGRVHAANMVAITFTEKAADELASRIRSAIAREMYRSDLPQEERQRLADALDELDRATISTIHSFCRRLLHEKPAEAGVDPEFSMLEPAACEVLQSECWREWMERQVAECPPALTTALAAGVRIGALQDLAWAICGMPEVLDEPRCALQRPAEALGPAAAALHGTAVAVSALFQEHMKKRGNKDARAMRDAARDLAEADPPITAAMTARAVAAAAGGPEKAITSLPRDQRDDILPRLEEFVEAGRTCAAFLACDLFDWLRGFAEEYRRAKEARSGLDFQDLLLLATRVVRTRPDVRSYFQGRYGAFFIDEFQDTDPLQAELIAYLCARGAEASDMGAVRLAEGKLVAVGDPKQSIYRFRRADVQIYERFKGLFPPESVRRVSCNFRSTPRLLAWLNRLFERLLAAPVPAGAYQAEHVALEPPHPDDAPGGVPVAVLYPTPEILGRKLKAIEARRQEAAHLARFIRDVVSGGLSLPGHEEPFRHRDFALLFRSMTDVGIYEDALDEAGIPYRTIGGKHFYRRGPIVEMLQLLRAVNDPLDETAVVGALRSAFFGLSDEELFSHRAAGGGWDYTAGTPGDGPVAEALAILADWHRRRNAVGAHRLAREILDRTRADRIFVLRPAGCQRVASLNKLIGQMRVLAGFHTTFSAVIDYLSSVQDAEVAEEEAGAVEPGDDFVRLLTMHKSKGLQFPVVVLPDLSRRLPVARGAALLIDRCNEAVGLRAVRGLETLNFRSLADEEAGNESAEHVRLLYVACTRAERLLVLPRCWSVPSGFDRMLADAGTLIEPPKAPRGAERDDVYYVDAAQLSTPEPRADRMPTGPVDVESLMAARADWLAAHEDLVRRASPPEAAVTPSSLEGPVREQAAGDAAESGPGGAGFGTLFHNLMRHVPLEEAGPGTAEAVRGLAVLGAAQLGLDEEAARLAAELADRTLAHPEFRALLDGATSVGREVSFTVPLANLPDVSGGADGFLDGSIDVLIGREDRTVILDYKTDRFDPGEIDRVGDRYWPQLAAYALAARACGRAPGEVDLSLCFVRPGILLTRRMGPELVRTAAGRIASAASQAP